MSKRKEYRNTPIYKLLLEGLPRFRKEIHLAGSITKELDIVGLAEELNYHRRTIYNWCSTGRIRSTTVPKLVQLSEGNLTAEQFAELLY